MLRLISSVTALCCSAAVAIWVLRLLMWLTEPAISSRPVFTRAVASAADWQLAWVFSMAATEELTPAVRRVSISLIAAIPTAISYTRVSMKTTLRLALLSALFTTTLAQAAELIPIDVHRDANCGCCKKWISHLQSNGFKVNDHVEADMSAVKQRLGVAPRLGSCHTAVIDGKFVEGHVPAEQVLA